MSEERSGFRHRIQVWAGVVLMNLLLPGCLGGATANVGTGFSWLGMLLGVGVLWAIGLVACEIGGRLYDVLVAGGIGVAFLQFFPILHIVAGIIAFVTWTIFTGEELVDLPDRGPVWSAFRCFVLTLLTGQMLLFAAVVLDFAVRWVHPPTPPTGRSE